MDVLTDWRGTTIEVGDIILYPVRGGSSMTVNEAIVLGIGEDDHGWMSTPETFVRARWVRSADNDTRDIKNVTLTNLSNITVMRKHDA